MSIAAQTLRLCTVIGLAAGVLALLRGVPGPQAPEPEAVACAAPAEGEEEGGVRWISQQEARSLVGDGNVTFVDCRSRGEFEAGHVSGSIHVPPERDPLEEPVLEAVQGRTVVTYCDAGQQCERSLRIAARLAAAGLPDVRVLEGGMPMWLRNGYPAESGTCSLCPKGN